MRIAHVFLSAILLTACGVGDPSTLPADSNIEPDPPDDALVAVSVVQVGDAEYSFYAWDDGSAGVLAATDTSLSSGLEADGLLDEASIAEVFWALSEPGATIPDALLDHHDAMAEETRPMEVWGAQGWLADEMMRAPPPPSSPCLNATFNGNICGSSTYPQGPGCYNNQTSGRSWRTNGTRRYRAGVCVQNGSVNDTLTYSNYTNSSTCNIVYRSYHAIWGDSVTAYPNPQSDIYLSWAWIAPSNASRRTWTHRATPLSGGVYDWGTKQLTTTDCRH